jgi:cytoskeletal protein RodZ
MQFALDAARAQIHITLICKDFICTRQLARRLLNTPRERYDRNPFPPYRSINMRNVHALTAAIVLALSLSACQQPETPTEVRQDVQEARQEGAKEVAEAQRDAAETRADAQQNVAGAMNQGAEEVREEQADALDDTAKAAYDVTVAQADATLKVEREKCDAVAGDARDACQKAADAAYEATKADAQMKLDAAQRAADDLDN